MTNYTIPCETIVRFSKVVSFFKVSTDEETKALINTIRLENKGGKSYAVVTNQEIAAVEYLGETAQADGACHLKLTEELLEQMKKDSRLGLHANITTIPAIALSTLQTLTGAVFNDCSYWFGETPLDNWRKWIPPVIKQSKGAMYWDLYQIEALLSSSPTGKVTFPEFIDNEKPVLIRDRSNKNWIGLFIPNIDIGEPDVKAATLPEWLK
jgi:hypothetical protein